MFAVSARSDMFKRINRVILTACDAENIYKEKLLIANSNPNTLTRTSSKTLRGQSVSVSTRFDVSPKTIRDIWNRRTWLRATCHLWHLDNSDFGPEYSEEHWKKVSHSHDTTPETMRN